MGHQFTIEGDEAYALASELAMLIAYAIAKHTGEPLLLTDIIPALAA